MFSAIDKTFHNHHFTFQHTVTTQSLNKQIRTSTTKITFTSQNSYFLLVHIKFY